jgi:hypothetical protein
MPSANDPLERLRSTIDQLAASDAKSLVDEARTEARARVRSRLADLMERAMLEHVQEQVVPPSPQPRVPAQQVSRPEPSADTESDAGAAWYVYGVVEGDTELEGPLAGVDASGRVKLLAEGTVAAAVSEVALEEFGEARLREHLRNMEWVERVARAHETVLDQIREKSTVIPMRMCTVYRSESGVREMLRREAAALREAIDHLDGKAEWGVKAFADLQHMSAVAADDEQDAADEARGAAYMRRRQSERDTRERAQQQLEEAAAQIHERLCELAGDGHVMPPQRPEVSGHAGDMVLNGVYLVSDDDRERFHAEVQLLEAEFAPLGVELALTGPWPAYNFVSGTIGAAW